MPTSRLNSKVLLAVSGHKLRPRHLAILAVLAVAFSASFVARSQTLQFGFELHEFDPFFNYRATEYLLDNGLEQYLDWHDDLSWHPIGRDISATSQVMLHVTTAVLWKVFGAGSELYDFAIVMPAVIGSLTVVVIFALVRTIAGTLAGLFAALFFSVSIPILLRGTLGWFKSEPLGLFYGLLAVYLLLSGLHSGRRSAVLRMAGAGVLLGFGLSAWGGVQFFVMPIGIFILIMPFLDRKGTTKAWLIPVFVSSTLLVSLLFERPGPSFVFGMGGIALAVPTVFLVACSLMRKMGWKHHLRNCLLLLLGMAVLGIGIVAANEGAGLLNISQGRYLHAINPFSTVTDPLTASVSEHAITSVKESFLFHSVLMIFAGLGAWLLIRSGMAGRVRPEMAAFVLILAASGAYVGSTFIRLEVLTSLSIIALASVGLSLLVQEVASRPLRWKGRKNAAIRASFYAALGLLLLVPLVMPTGISLLAVIAAPPTISNGGTVYAMQAEDWPESLEWIRTNTPEGSVIAAWWDYGYWISTMSDRPTIADNATINSDHIKMLAGAFVGTPDAGWQTLRDMGADYVVVFVSGEQLALETEEPLYLLRGGGEESKMRWIAMIASQPASNYLHIDGQTPTDYFWNETLLGKLFPFSTVGYVNLNTMEAVPDFELGMSALYMRDVKYLPEDEGAPFHLVHASPSYYRNWPGPALGVFVYELNPDYEPIVVYTGQ